MPSTSPRTLTRMPEKQSLNRADLSALLDEVYLATVAYSTEEGVDAAPVAIAEHGNSIIWHGSTGSGWMRSIAGQLPVAVTISSIDALVVGRSTFENSFWYRSAVIRGVPRPLLGDEQRTALEVLTDRIIPGRVQETRAPSGKERAATMVFALPLIDWTLKMSRRWPTDSPQDRATDAWAGVLPVRTAYGPPQPSPDLAQAIPVPESCLRLCGTQR